ncbi:oxidoreductase [Mycobacterium sp. CBMA293]|uniref:PDR/VanB family oxidoreductase n=1 Tax=unclassified Mycolicibacterium TaxID=2636767 RepID=UPI0012DF6FD1|nr:MULTISPECIES: PDR/VanB family oxidoreductase [unclassified Mycolicibacterium]MUL50116.1 oxidoreductase [Mycolicibacterium sp. CBMA 360]MUL62776.1 oxidoreductase [Mycolicibacterium sp. CBMA 335]MUL69594.1 oxidoreductase [Mycolicibacterium sp. CBMA 311]MUL93547.1 oxidoreductase [Mycolicibacterium sp. CBMA 230]MUM07955.1 oxidoreductase [Mycolicibacterium sp. CBMA 213]
MTTEALQPVVHPAVEAGFELEVTGRHLQTDSIVSITFRDPSGTRLPSYVAGSHLVVQYGDSANLRANAYSLTGSGNDPAEYTISVLLVEDGDGGSVAMHQLAVGDRVWVSRPRSNFAPTANAKHTLLVAAGIGITPVLSHARYAAEWGTSASMIYVYRRGQGAHVDEAKDLLGSALTECHDRNSFQKVLTEQLTSQHLGTHLYVCGPADFMDSVLEQARELGWPEGLLHLEHFGAGQLDAGEPFAAILVRSGVRLEVPAGVSLLEALEKEGKQIPNMCRKGICGECTVPVLRGTPHHRDIYLSDEEKEENALMMCCVSRSVDQELELDL